MKTVSSVALSLCLAACARVEVRDGGQPGSQALVRPDKMSVQMPPASGTRQLQAASRPVTTPRVTSEVPVPPEGKPGKEIPTEDVISVGFASIGVQPATDPAEKRLQAIRSAKLDAYRALAEQVFGIEINVEHRATDGQSAYEFSSVRSRGLIQGAEIVSIDPINNDSYQVTVKLKAADVYHARQINSEL